MRTKEKYLLESHGDKDYNFHDIITAMHNHKNDAVNYALEMHAKDTICKVQAERDTIRQMVYTAIPTGEVTAWDCILAFNKLVKDIDERDNIVNED